MITDHEAVQIRVGDEYVLIDKELATLVKALNEAGLKTTASCQGNPDLSHIQGALHWAYISIDLHEIEVDVINGKVSIRWPRWVHADGGK